MTRFMCDGDRKAGETNSSVPTETAIETNPLQVSVEKCLGVGQFDIQVHVIDYFGKCSLEAAKQGVGPSTRPRRMTRPQKASRHRGIEERHDLSMMRVFRERFYTEINPP